MKVSCTWFLLLFGAAALAPAALRSAYWFGQRGRPVDPAMAQAGEELFRHEWTPSDPLAGGGDGLGPVFNAASCVACHHQNGAGGGGALTENVTTFAVRSSDPKVLAREGVVHARSTGPQAETLADVDASLPRVSAPSLEMLVPRAGKGRVTIEVPKHVQLAQLNTPALFGAKLIDDIPERIIVVNERRQRLKWGKAPAERDAAPVGRLSRLPDGRLGRFGWKAQTAHLSDFVRAACANELGLGNPGHAQPRPLFAPDYQPPGLDLTDEQCDQLTAFVASLPRPVERLPEEPDAAAGAVAGKRAFHAIGCAECHTPDLGSVSGLYSDLLLHPMNAELQAGPTSYSAPVPKLEAVPDVATGDRPLAREWRTPPLWGVADSAPYMHDGRAATLDEAIRLHGGQALTAAREYEHLRADERGQLISFLKTLRAP